MTELCKVLPYESEADLLWAILERIRRVHVKVREMNPRREADFCGVVYEVSGLVEHLDTQTDPTDIRLSEDSPQARASHLTTSRDQQEATDDRTRLRARRNTRGAIDGAIILRSSFRPRLSPSSCRTCSSGARWRRRRRPGRLASAPTSRGTTSTGAERCAHAYLR